MAAELIRQLADGRLQRPTGPEFEVDRIPRDRPTAEHSCDERRNRSDEAKAIVGLLPIAVARSITDNSRSTEHPRGC